MPKFYCFHRLLLNFYISLASSKPLKYQASNSASDKLLTPFSNKRVKGLSLNFVIQKTGGRKMKIKDLVSIALEIFAWGGLIFLIILGILKIIGILKSPTSMEIDLSINTVISSWLFWLTKEFWEFKSETNSKLNLILSKFKRK